MLLFFILLLLKEIKQQDEGAILQLEELKRSSIAAISRWKTESQRIFFKMFILVICVHVLDIFSFIV